MNILLINVHSAVNAGDAVLNEVAIQQLQQNFPKSNIKLAMNDPVSGMNDWDVVGSFSYWIKSNQSGWHWGVMVHLLTVSLWSVVNYRIFHRASVGKAEWATLLSAYLEADFVASCPGNFLYSSGRLGLPLWLAVYSMIYSWLLGKPLYLLPQTVGPLTRRIDCWLVVLALRCARLIFVRDDISLKTVMSMGRFDAKCHLIPDMAFAYPSDLSRSGVDLLLSNGIDVEKQGPLLGVTLINWVEQNSGFKKQTEYESAVAQAIKSFVEEFQGEVILFSQVCGPTKADDDRIPALRVYQTYLEKSYSNRVYVITEPISANILKAAYSLMDIFIGSRLHSNIFALSEEVPVIALQYQYKTRGIMRMLELEEWVLEIEAVDADKLIHMMNHLWTHQQPIRNHLASVIPEMIEDVNRVGLFIANDLLFIKGND